MSVISCLIIRPIETFLEKSGKERECPNRATARELFNRRFVLTRYLQIIPRYIVSG